MIFFVEQSIVNKIACAVPKQNAKYVKQSKSAVRRKTDGVVRRSGIRRQT